MKKGMVFPNPTLYTNKGRRLATFICGKSGIQTHGTARPYAGFRVRSIRSLWHLSEREGTHFFDSESKSRKEKSNT